MVAVECDWDLGLEGRSAAAEQAACEVGLMEEALVGFCNSELDAGK